MAHPGQRHEWVRFFAFARAKGYNVENGEIVGRVKDTMIAGNVYQVLKGLRGIGQETRWVGGTVQTPHLYCSGVSVTTKGS